MTDAAKLPVKSSGYKTTCKLASYIFQTCLMVKLYTVMKFYSKNAVDLTFWFFQNCPQKHKKVGYEEAVNSLIGCDATALVKTPEQTAKDAMQILVNMDAKKLDKSLKEVKLNAKKIEAEIPKDILDKINGAVPKGTKVETFDEKKLINDIKSNSNNPSDLSKKYNIDTKQVLELFGK